MIFVTVGTAAPFDELLREVDRLAARDFFGERLVCQGGHSAYRLAHGEQFMARPSIADLIHESSTVVTHGGATVIECLTARKPFIAFPNPRCAGDHQTSFLRQVAEVCDISWSKNVSDLAGLFVYRRHLGPAEIKADLVRAADVIRTIL